LERRHQAGGDARRRITNCKYKNASHQSYFFLLLYYMLDSPMFAWTDILYSKKPYEIDLLSSSNWSSWNATATQLIQPYDCVADILHGRLEPGDPLYSTTIDIELFFFLAKIIDDDLQPIILEARARHGMSGSQLYRILRARFEQSVSLGKVIPATSHKHSTSVQTTTSNQLIIRKASDDSAPCKTTKQEPPEKKSKLARLAGINPKPIPLCLTSPGKLRITS
jgi:hypothetical protein